MGRVAVRQSPLLCSKYAPTAVVRLSLGFRIRHMADLYRRFLQMAVIPAATGRLIRPVLHSCGWHV
jgi:hypothetical protein